VQETLAFFEGNENLVQQLGLGVVVGGCGLWVVVVGCGLLMVFECVSSWVHAPD
jgi:hypothetical protein